MKKYEKYRDSGIEWLGEVPEHWKIRRIKDIFYLQRGRFSHRPRNDQRMYENGIYPFIQTGDVSKSNKYIISYEQTLNQNGIKVSKLFKKDTLVMTIAANIGDVAMIAFDSYFPDSLVAFNTKYNKDFYFYLLQTTKEELNTVKVTNTQDNLNLERLNSLHKLLPPISEQILIGNYLDTKTQLIDKKIELLNKKINLFKELRKSLINKAVCRGLDDSVKLKDSGIDWIGKIPEHWKVKRVKDVFETLAGGTPSTKNEKYWEGIIPWIPSGKVQNNYITSDTVEDYISKEALIDSSTKLAKRDSILIALTGATCSNVGYLKFDTTINQSIVAISSKKNDLIIEYYFYFLLSAREKLRTMMTGGAQGGINQEDIRFFKIILPPISEQGFILSFVKDKIKNIVIIQNNLQQQIAKLQELRKTLINDVVTGKIKVTE